MTTFIACFREVTTLRVKKRENWETQDFQQVYWFKIIYQKSIFWHWIYKFKRCKARHYFYLLLKGGRSYAASSVVEITFLLNNSIALDPDSICGIFCQSCENHSKQRLHSTLLGLYHYSTFWIFCRRFLSHSKQSLHSIYRLFYRHSTFGFVCCMTADHSRLR